MPTDYVLVPVSVSDTSEATLDVSQLIFTPDNWNVVQQITITGVDDLINDGDQNYDLVFANIQSTDQNYTSISLDSILLTNIGDGVYTPLVDIVMNKSILSTGPYNVGDNVTYELVISNIGADDATDVVVTENMTNLTLVSATGGNCLPVDTFPCTISSIPAATSQTIILIASINTLGTFDNSAAAIATEDDVDISNNTDDSNNSGISVGPNLGVVISNCESELGLNQDIIYELTVTNLGDLDIEDAILTNTLSVYLDNISWSCQAFNGAACPQDNGNTAVAAIINLPIASSITYLISASVTGAYNDIVEAVASITMPSGVTDINPSNNTASDIDIILGLIFLNGFESFSAGECN